MQAKLSTSWSTMGLGVAIDLGDIDPFISYGTAEGSAGSANNTKSEERPLRKRDWFDICSWGSDTITVVVGSLSDQYDTSDGAGGGTVDKPTDVVYYGSWLFHNGWTCFFGDWLWYCSQG